MTWQEGIIVRGDGRGKTLGFPTLNVNVEATDLEEGVFAVLVQLSDQECQGIAHIGARPTFAKTELSLEIHLFDFTAEIAANTRIEFQLLEKIREVQKFESAEELVKQIERDVEEVKSFFDK
jgi:riboflavin kinase/FMN adenylyltransferase